MPRRTAKSCPHRGKRSGPVPRSSEKLFPARHLDAIHKLRRTMVDLNPIEAMETLLAACRKHKTNEELLSKLQ